ncbi:Beta-fructofuranosidase insoluble isoenzyme CWINV1, partial [Bienertia sinuspersici]
DQCSIKDCITYFISTIPWAMAHPTVLTYHYLKEWILIPQNPVITPNQSKVDPINFRDPTTTWTLPDGTWRVVIGGVRKNRGMALLYRSKTLFIGLRLTTLCIWNKIVGCGNVQIFSRFIKRVVQILALTQITNHVLRKNKQVLKLSLVANQHDVYSIGTYDMSLLLIKGLSMTRTFYDAARNRRILFAWVMETISDAESVSNGWAGIQVKL